MGCIRQHPSCREVVEMQLLSKVHFSIHLCFILLTVKRTHICFSFFIFCFFFFSRFSGALGGHVSAMGNEVSHGCLSFILGLHVHAQETIFFPHAKSAEFVISKKKNKTKTQLVVSDWVSRSACLCWAQIPGSSALSLYTLVGITLSKPPISTIDQLFP